MYTISKLHHLEAPCIVPSSIIFDVTAANKFTFKEGVRGTNVVEQFAPIEKMVKADLSKCVAEG